MRGETKMYEFHNAYRSIAATIRFSLLKIRSLIASCTKFAAGILNLKVNLTTSTSSECSGTIGNNAPCL